MLKSNKILTHKDQDSEYDKQRTNMGVRSGPKLPDRGQINVMTEDGTFNTSSGWTVTPGSLGDSDNWSISNGVATIDGSQSANRWMIMRFPLNNYYKVIITVTRTAGTVSLSYSNGNITSGTEMTLSGTYTHGPHQVTINDIIYIRADSSFSGTVTDVKVIQTDANGVPVSHLALCLDAMNAKSFAGEPTTNIITDGDCNDGAHPDNVSFGFEASVSIVDCPIDDTGFRPSPKAMKLSKTSSTNGRIFFGSGWPTLDSDSGAATHPYCMSAWFYIPTSSTGNGNSSVGGRPFFNTDNSANSATINSHRTYHVNDKGKWIKLVNEFYSKNGLHTHGFRVLSDDPIGAIYYMTEVQVEKKDHATPFVDGSRAAANAWRDISGNGNHGTFSSVDLGAASEDIHFVRRGSIILPNPDTNPTTNFVPAGRGVVANTDRPASINFDGSNDIITVANDTALNTPEGASFCFWFNADNAGTSSQTLLSRGTSDSSTTPDNPRIEIAGGTDCRIYFDWSVTGSDNYCQTVNGSFSKETWTHCVCTIVAGGRMEIFVNGNIPAYQNRNNADTVPDPLVNNATDIQIGGATWIPRYFNGKIACVQIYNTQLSHANIKQIYNAQKSRFGL